MNSFKCDSQRLITMTILSIPPVAKDSNQSGLRKYIQFFTTTKKNIQADNPGGVRGLYTTENPNL